MATGAVNPQDLAPRQRRRQWIAAAAAAVAVAVFAVIVLLQDSSGAEDDPVQTGEQTNRPLSVPKFSPGLTPGEDPPAETEGPPANPAACNACAEKHRGGGGAQSCVHNMGCDGLGGGDKKLCEDLLQCLLAHPRCYRDDPVWCYCGSSQGLACTREPKGVCAKQGLAATKTMDPMEASLRFFLPDYPSGRASQVAACRVRFCKEECQAVKK